MISKQMARYTSVMSARNFTQDFAFDKLSLDRRNTWNNAVSMVHRYADAHGLT